MDEADDMFRTTDRRQVFERALSKLQAMNPSMASYYLYNAVIGFKSVPFSLISAYSIYVSDYDDFSHTSTVHASTHSG